MKKWIYVIVAVAVAIPVVVLAQGVCCCSSCSKNNKDIEDVKGHVKDGAKVIKDASVEKTEEAKQRSKDIYQDSKDA